MLRPPARARALCLARTCLRWEECVVWEEGGWGPGGKRCGAFQKDRFLWEISLEIKVLSAEIRVRKYTYNRREILVWANRGGGVPNPDVCTHTLYSAVYAATAHIHVSYKCIRMSEVR